MTGGQYSPTTPTNDYGTTVPYGNIDKTFDLCNLAQAAGATYVARSTAYHARIIERYIENGLDNKGFSFIEGISVCPTYYGRKNKKGGAVDMMKGLKENTVDIRIANKKPELAEGKLLIGEFHNSEEEEYTARYDKIIELFEKE